MALDSIFFSREIKLQAEDFSGFEFFETTSPQTASVEMASVEMASIFNKDGGVRGLRRG